MDTARIGHAIAVASAVAATLAGMPAIAGDYCAVTSRLADCGYATREACERALHDLHDVHDRCIANPGAIVQPAPPQLGPLAPAKVTTLPPDPPLSSAPGLQDSWRRGVDVGKQVRDEQLDAPAFGIPVPSSRYLPLFRCTSTTGVPNYTAAGGAGCVLVNVQAF